MADDDDLVALIDGELEEPRKGELLARLDRDPVLRHRYQALQATTAPIGAALEFALDSAPVERLRALLPAASSPPAAAQGPRLRGLALRELAAGLVVGFLAAASLAWIAFGEATVGQDDWRSAVVDYMELYTRETFAFAAPDLPTQASELARIGGRVGTPLTPEAVAAPGLAFKTAFLLGYDGAPLGEIAYVDPIGEPVLLCILKEGSRDATMRLERRGGYGLATWARGGRQFLVIGRLPDAQIADYARALETRL